MACYGLLWLKATEDTDSGEATNKIVMLNTMTMSLTSGAVFAKRTRHHHYNYLHKYYVYYKIVEEPSCFQSIAPTIVGIGMIIAALLSFGMWSSHKLTAASVTICVLRHPLMLLQNLDVTFSVVFVGCPIMCFVLIMHCVLFTKVQEKVIIWTFYMPLLVLGGAWLFMGDSEAGFFV
jgi:hypothetical protein